MNHDDRLHLTALRLQSAKVKKQKTKIQACLGRSKTNGGRATGYPATSENPEKKRGQTTNIKLDGDQYAKDRRSCLSISNVLLGLTS